MNNIILSLIVAILPIYLIGLYVYKKDKDKESRKLLSKLFIFGIISCIPAVILEVIIGGFFGAEEDMGLFTLLLYVFISIAFVEEICKWFFVYKIAYNHQEFDHIYDAIVYCVFVSLGFAAFENIFYVLGGDISTGLIRAVSAVPGHACFAIVMGNYLGMGKIAEINGNLELSKKNLRLSIIMPTLVHGLYDYCLFTENGIFFIVFIIFLIYVYVFSVKRIKKLSNIENNFITKKVDVNILNSVNTSNNVNVNFANFCPNCGMKANGKFCTNCGKNLSLTEINHSNNLTQ